MSGTSPETLVSAVRNSIPNNGFGPWRIIPLDLMAAKTPASPPALLTGVTTPSSVYSTGTHSLRYTSAMTSTTAFLQTLTVPEDAQDFDTATASPYTRGVQLKLVGRMRVANAAETAIPAATLYAQGYGTYADATTLTGSTKALSAVITASFRRIDPVSNRLVSSTAMSQLANAVDYFELDFTEALDSGNLRIQPGNVLAILCNMSAATTVGNCDWLSLSAWYRTNLDVTNRKQR